MTGIIEHPPPYFNTVYDPNLQPMTTIQVVLGQLHTRVSPHAV